MNYYNPNFYQNYPYAAATPYQSQPAPAPQPLNGKLVDSEDIVRATEVPIGGYGVFPKADLSEIYIKSWNQNGTTNIVTFKPVIPPPIEEGNSNKEILERIKNLENKMDEILAKEPPKVQKGRANEY